MNLTFARLARVVGLLALVGATAACGSSTSSSASTAAGASSSGGGITVAKAWIRTTPAGTTTGAAYVTLTAATADSLVGVAVEKTVAGSASLHETTGGSATTMAGSTMAGSTMAGSSMSGSTMAGEMSMQPVAAIDLPAGKAVSLAPGGYHIMLMDLVAPLKAGTKVTLQLTFKNAGTKATTFTVSDDAP